MTELEKDDKINLIHEAQEELRNAMLYDLGRKVYPPELEKAVEDFYRKVFIHAMKVGQEFPDDDPTKMSDPCNAEDREILLALIQDEVRKARIDELLYLTNHCDPLFLDSVYIQLRIKQLSKGKE